MTECGIAFCHYVFYMFCMVWVLGENTNDLQKAFFDTVFFIGIKAKDKIGYLSLGE